MNKALLLKIMGLLLIIISFLVNQYSIIRLVTILLGIIFIVLANKKKTIYTLIEGILFVILLFGIDTILVQYLNRIPIFAYEIKSATNMSTYNSFFYRVYNCDGTHKFDGHYQKNYLCETILPEENINSLLANIENNFADYKNKFVNVKGKISSISGSKSISMQTFEVLNNSINGQVNFSDNITLTILNNGKLEKVEDLKIYDSINIIGRIVKINKQGQNKEIIMDDARIISRNSFDTYEINVVTSKTCESDLKLMSKTDTYNYYNSCLDSIYVTYDNENRYELSYVLTDKRMTFDLLIQGKEKEEKNDMELYTYKDFNILKCNNSNNVIIGDKNLNLDSPYCASFTVEDDLKVEGES